MKILILTTSQSSSGGVERFCYYLRDIMADEGNSVELLSWEGFSGFSMFLFKASKYVALQQPVLGWLLGREALKKGFDVCITLGLLGWNIASRKTVNVQQGTFARAAIRVDRNRNTIKYLIKRYVWGYFEGLAGRRATRCVAVSNETKESTQKYYGVAHVDVIANASDTSRFKPMGLPKKDQAIFVGRFEYAKGKGVLDGVRPYLESQGWSLLVAEQLSQEELAIAYNESKIFLFPSLHEGCSFALVDAMACGLPFLASPVGLVPDFLHEGVFQQCVVIEQTVDAYLAKMKPLMSMDEAQQRDMSESLRSYVLEKGLDLESFRRSYLAILREVSN